MGYMLESVGRQLGNFSGEFLEYDAKNNSSIWRDCIRICIRLDVRKPIKRKKKIVKKDGSQFVVTCRYERLGKFCFRVAWSPTMIYSAEIMLILKEKRGTKIGAAG